MRRRIAVPIVTLLLSGSLPCLAAAPSRASRSTANQTSATRPAEGSVVISDLLDLHAACGVVSCGRGTHGGTQSRICHTSHGAYASFLAEDKEGGTVFHLVRIREGSASLLHSVTTPLTGANSVHVLSDAQENVHVLAAGVVSVEGRERASLCIHHLDRETGTVTHHCAEIPFGHGTSFGYSSAGIDLAQRRIYAVYSGGDAPGYFAWFTFDLATMAWLPRPVVIDLQYRHCYNYCFADGRGGMIILSERDIKNATAGITPADTNRKIDANYVWDELRLFLIRDLTLPAYTTVDVENAVYDKKAGLYPNVQNNSQGDAYMDTQGHLHVLYMSDDNNGVAGSFLRHAAYDRRFACVHNERLGFQGAHAMRMAQATCGRHYIIAMPYRETARVRIWGATDDQGLGYTLAGEKQFDTGLTPTYAGLAVSCPRNGSVRDDVIDCLFPVDHNYYYFSVTLKTK